MLNIYTTGGTIDKTYFDQKDSYHVGKPQVSGILERANVTIDYTVYPLLQKDSLDITEADRTLIANTLQADSCDRIIITHGTDTMVDTAIAIKPVMNKTIVLTGSMYPAQYRDSDAVFNLACAVTAAQTLEHGVYIAMNGQIFKPEHTVKNIDENRFEQR